MEAPLQSERRSSAHVVVTFHDAAIHQEILSEKTAPLNNVNDFGGRTQPIMEGVRSALEIEGLVLI
jgi:hypothetical protein